MTLQGAPTLFLTHFLHQSIDTQPDPLCLYDSTIVDNDGDMSSFYYLTTIVSLYMN